MRQLTILRGAPGAGKSVLARKVANGSGVVCEADQFFTGTDGTYRFVGRLLPAAHEWCRRKVEDAMKNSLANIIVANCNLEKWNFEPYLSMAKVYNYHVQVLVLLGQYMNVHGVPEDKVIDMRERLRENLILELKKGEILCG